MGNGNVSPTSSSQVTLGTITVWEIDNSLILVY